MKFLFLIAALCVLTVSADDASYKAEICFKKVTKCCYKYKKCDYIEKKIPVKKRCDFKKCKLECKNVCKDECKNICKDQCKHVCRNECKNVKVRVPKKACKPAYKWGCTKVKGMYGLWYPKCGWTKSGEKCKQYDAYIWKKICKRVCVKKCKKVCVKKCNPVCVKKCKKVCHTVKAVCIYYKTVKFAKYCPELKCEKEAVIDKKEQPKDVVSKKAIFVSKTEPKREILGKEY